MGPDALWCKKLTTQLYAEACDGICRKCPVNGGPEWCRNRFLPLHEGRGAWKETGLERIGPVYKYMDRIYMVYERSYSKKPCLECFLEHECDFYPDKFYECPGVRGKDYILQIIHTDMNDGLRCEWKSLGWINADDGRSAVITELDKLADEFYWEKVDE